jgi:hypothetical protein
LRTRFGIFKDIFMIFMIISASRRDLFADGWSNIVFLLFLADSFWGNHEFGFCFCSGFFFLRITHTDTGNCLDCIHGLRYCLIQFLLPGLERFESFHVFNHLFIFLLFAEIPNDSWDHGKWTEKECACKKSNDNLINVVVNKP